MPNAVRNPAEDGRWSAGWLAALLLGIAGPAEAQHYDFDLTRIEVDSYSSFVDDFSDGDRNAPPTSALGDLYGVTTEEPGALRLTSADGADAFAYELSLQEPATGLRDVAILASPGFFDGLGPGVFRTTWAGPAPEVTGLDYDRQFFQLLLLQESFSPVVTFSVLASSDTGDYAAITCQGAGQPSVSVTYASQGVIFFACDPFDAAEVTGPIVLESSFDDTDNRLSFAYSLDGGASFRPWSTWQNPATFPALADGSSAILGLGASATRLPSELPGPGIAAAALLLVTGIPLARRRRRAPR